MRTNSVRFTLKSATIAQHRRLDKALAHALVTTRQGYCRFLERMASAMLPTEALLDRSGVAEIFGDWPTRRRRDLVLADLAGLGACASELSTRTDATSLCRGGVFGAMYVLEGSRLGAPVILERVLGGGDPHVTENCRFLQSGAGASLWRSFCIALDGERELERDPSAAVRAAVGTFETFERSLVGAIQEERCHDRR